MRLVLVVFSIVLVAAPVQAQRSPHDRALRLFQESRAEYDAGRFDEAVTLLREAYDLEPDPVLLYNMARAYEGAGRVEQAIETYERYLHDAGEIRDRGAIERRLGTLREQLARQHELERATAEPEPEPAIVPPVEPTPSSAPREEGNGADPVPWVIAGVGVLGVGAGVVLGVLAQDAHAQATLEPVHARAFDQQEQAYTLATGANVAFIAGGAVALAGLVWAIVSLATSGPSRASASRPFELRF